MGVLVSNKLLIKKSLIILSGLCGVIGIILNSVAMGTNFWITSSGCQVVGDGTCDSAENTHLSVNYGLFSGLKALDSGLSPNYYPLKVFCPADGQGLCLLSCGKNVDEQKREFDLVRDEGIIFNCTSSTTKNSKSLSEASSIQVKSNVPRNPGPPESFLPFGFWLATVIFLSLTIAFQVLATGLCALNSLPEVPVEVWLGPMGIYIANGATSLTSLITLAIWGDLYSTHLSNEIAIQETILDTWSTDSTNLGYSYWLVFVSLLLTIASTILIRFRNVPKKHVTDKEGASEAGATPGVILLY